MPTLNSGIGSGSTYGLTYFGLEAQNIQAFALQQAASANNYVLRLAEIASTLVPPVIEPVFTDPGSAPPIAISAPPSLTPIAWDAPGIPGAFTGTLDLGAYLPAPFDEDPPTLAFPAAPAAFSEVAPDAPGVDLQIVYPELDVSLPAPPALLSIKTRDFSGVNIPNFTELAPQLTVVAPSIREYTPGAGYASALLTATLTSLQSRITNGGTGLRPDIENAIWDRAREREYRQLGDAIAELDRFEALGYALPPGVYLDARLKLQTEISYANAGHSREVMIKQAELEQANVRDALGQAIQVETVQINQTNAVEQRLFEASRYATEAGISIYNAQVQAYGAYLDAYKAKIAAYEAQIRGELGRVEAYRTEIAAEQAKSDINRARVEQYKVQTDVALSAIEVFKAEIAAIQSKADIERLKVQIFGEQIRGYATKVNAYTAQVEGFQASLRAETTKQEAYTGKVNAYAAQVTAGGRAIEARIAEYKAQIDQKLAEWEGYKAIAQAESERIRALAASNASVVDAYKAQVTGESSYNELLTKQWQVSYEQAQRVAEIGVAAAKANADLAQTSRSLALDAAKTGAQVNSQLGAAAMNAVNYSNSASQSASAAISASFSDSTSESQSRSETYSNTASISTSINNTTNNSTSVTDAIQNTNSTSYAKNTQDTDQRVVSTDNRTSYAKNYQDSVSYNRSESEQHIQSDTTATNTSTNNYIYNF